MVGWLNEVGWAGTLKASFTDFGNWLGDAGGCDAPKEAGGNGAGPILFALGERFD